MDLMSGAVGAIVGGLGASLLNHFLSKPDIKLAVSEVGIDPLQPRGKEGIADEIISKGASDFLIVSKEYRKLIGRHNYVSAPSKSYQHPLLYTWDLYEISRDNANAKLSNAHLNSVVKNLRQYLNSNMESAFLDEWIENQREIMAHVIGEARRGNFSLPLQDQNKQAKYRVGQDDDGDYVVRVGSKNIAFLYTDAPTHKDVAQEVCKNLALGFSVFDLDALELVVKFLESITFNDPIFDQTEAATKEQLNRYSKVYIRLNVTNSGRTGASVLGTGKIKLLCSGYRMNKGSGELIESDITFDIHAVQEDKITPLPSIAVDAGSCKSVLFVSNEIIENLKSLEILDLYGSERTFKISVQGESKVHEVTSQFAPNK